MKDLNVWVGVGRLTRDAEAPQGNGPTRFSIAVNRTKKDGDQYVDEASFFEIEYWHKSLGPYLLKGKQVGIQGELRQERWEKDGQTRSKVVIVVNERAGIELLGSTGGQGEARTGQEAPRAAARPQNAPAGRESGGQGDSVDDFVDDIPF